MVDYREGIEQDKRALLAALAQGGTAAKQAVEQSQATNRAQQQEAVTAALRDAATRGAPQPAQAAVQGIIEAPGATRDAALGRRIGIDDAFLNATGAAETKYLDTLKTVPGVEALGLASRLGGGSRGGRGGGGGGGRGGGGRGGGGGGDQSDKYWWNWYYENELNKIYGGASSGGLSRLNRDIRSMGPTRGARLGAAKLVGAPRGYRMGEFGTDPRLRDIIQEGALQVREGTVTRGDFLRGVAAAAAQRGEKGQKQAVKRAKKKTR